MKREPAAGRLAGRAAAVSEAEPARRGGAADSSTPANITAKPRTPTMRLSHDHAGDEHSDADDGYEHACHDDGVVRAATAGADGRDEVDVVLIEAALHFFQEALLLLGKWHPVPLTARDGACNR